MGLLNGLSMGNILCFVHFCITFVSFIDVLRCETSSDRSMTWGVMLPNYFLPTEPTGKKMWLPPGRHYPYHLQMMVPAMRIALEKVEATYLQGWNISLQVEDSECHSAATQFQAADMKVDYKVHAYFGPVCEYAIMPAHRFAGRWNIPLITVGGQSVNYLTSTIMTKLMPPHYYVGEIIYEVWNQFGWRRGAMLYHFNDNGPQDPMLMAGAAYQYLNKGAGLNLTHERFNEFSQVDFAALLETAVVPTTSGRAWKSLNRLRTEMGRCKVNMAKWGYIDDDNINCDCGTSQTMQHLLQCPNLRERCCQEDLMVANEKALRCAKSWPNI